MCVKRLHPIPDLGNCSLHFRDVWWGCCHRRRWWWCEREECVRRPCKVKHDDGVGETGAWTERAAGSWMRTCLGSSAWSVWCRLVVGVCKSYGPHRPWLKGTKCPINGQHARCGDQSTVMVVGDTRFVPDGPSWLNAAGDSNLFARGK